MVTGFLFTFAEILKIMLEVKDTVLDYIRKMVETHLPDIDINDEGEPEFCPSSGLHTFVKRYNNNEIEYTFKYEDYLKNKEVQDTLKELDIDPEKFWYYLLFAYDFSYCKCVVGTVVKKSPAEQLQKFIDAIDDNTIEGNKVVFKKESKIILSIKGKRIIIDNPEAIYCLALLCEKGLNSIKSDTFNLSIGDGKTIKKESDSVFICLFTKIINSFFTDTFTVKPKAKKGDPVSLSFLLLISRLVYFTEISTNKNLLDDENTLNVCLKDYKNYKMKATNIIYFANWFDVKVW